LSNVLASILARVSSDAKLPALFLATSASQRFDWQRPHYTANLLKFIKSDRGSKGASGRLMLIRNFCGRIVTEKAVAP
jgi:hypothetical protein